MNSQARDIHVASQRLGGNAQESPKSNNKRLSPESSGKYLLNNQSSKNMQSPGSKEDLKAKKQHQFMNQNSMQSM